MRLRILPLALAALLAAPALSAGQTNSEYGQIRQSLIDILSKEISQTQEVNFRVKWSYLPPLNSENGADPKNPFGTGPGKRMFVAVGKEKDGGELVIPNSALMSRKNWESWEKSNPEKLKLLCQMTGGGKTLEESFSISDRRYSSPANYKSVFFDTEGRATGMSLVSFLRARRDFYAIRALLDGVRKRPEGEDQEVELSTYGGVLLDINPAPRGGARRFESKGKWSFRSITDGFSRLIEADYITDPIKMTFRKGLAGDARLNILSGLVKVDSQGQAFMSTSSTLLIVGAPAPEPEPGPVPEPVPNESEKKAGEVDSSVGNYILKLGGGLDYGGILGPLIDNESDARLFQGALLFGGKPVQIYGLNFVVQETSAARLGFIYGIIPRANESLYLGPSIELGPLTFSVGGRFGTKDDTKADVRLSGGISLDLTRILGRKDSSTIIEHEREDKTPYSVWGPTNKGIRAAFFDSGVDLKKTQFLLAVGEAPPRNVNLGAGLILFDIGDGTADALLKPQVGAAIFLADGEPIAVGSGEGEGLALDSSELPGQYRLAYYSASAALASAPAGLVLGEGVKNAYRPSPQTVSEFPDALAFIELQPGSYNLADGAEVVGKPEVTKIRVLAKGEDAEALDSTILQIRSGEKIDLKVKPSMKGSLSRLP